MSIKLTKGSGTNWLPETENAIQHIKSTWQYFYPESVFAFQFFDENIQEFYKEEVKFSSLTKIFSIVFLIIGCLGLHGLITFIILKKAKEISIRKVFGAAPAQIFNSIVKDHLQLVLIAFLIAAPIAYVMMQKWLDGFAYHINIQYWIILAPGLVMAVTTLLAISYHLVKAARINPTQVLRTP
jgi:putative ABC transport system permease protein